MTRRGRPSGNVVPLELKALYTVTELCAVTGLSRWRVEHLIHTCEIEVVSVGRSLYIPLSAIRTKLEPLWREIREVERVLRGDVEELE